MLSVTSVCFFCDVCEYSGEDLFAMVHAKATEKFLECMQLFHDDFSLIQSCSYGLGAIAKRAGVSFTLKQQVVAALKKVID